MTRDEINRLKGRVVGRTVPWGNCGGVVEDVTLVGADALSLSGFSGLDVKVATYFRLRGDGDRWGVRAAAKALGEGVISELAALALTCSEPHLEKLTTTLLRRVDAAGRDASKARTPVAASRSRKHDPTRLPFIAPKHNRF